MTQAGAPGPPGPVGVAGRTGAGRQPGRSPKGRRPAVPADTGTQPARAVSFPGPWDPAARRVAGGAEPEARPSAALGTRCWAWGRPSVLAVGACLCPLCSRWCRSPPQPQEQPAPPHPCPQLPCRARHSCPTPPRPHRALGVSVVLGTPPSMNFFWGSLSRGANPHAGGPYLPCLSWVSARRPGRAAAGSG